MERRKIHKGFSMQKLLILAYPASGKTYVAENYENVVDFEHQDFMWIYDAERAGLPLDQRRSNMQLRQPNPEWPRNYFAAMELEFAAERVLISPFIEAVFNVVHEAKLQDTRVVLVIPEIENFDELEARYHARNTGDEFIERRRADLPICRKLFDSADGYEKIILARGQFLDSALINHGIKLKKKSQ